MHFHSITSGMDFGNNNELLETYMYYYKSGLTPPPAAPIVLHYPPPDSMHPFFGVPSLSALSQLPPVSYLM